MTSSDNVARAGLTSKRVDAGGLARIADFSPGKARVFRPRPDGTYPVPIPAFRVRRLKAGREQNVKNAQLLLVIKGRAEAASEEGREELSSGEALFVPSASASRVSCRKGALVFSFQLTC